MKTLACIACILNGLFCFVSGAPAMGSSSDLSSFFSQASIPRGSFNVGSDSNGQIGIYYAPETATLNPYPEDDSEDSDESEPTQASFQYVMPKLQMPVLQMNSDRFIRSSGSSRNSDDWSSSGSSNSRSNQGRSDTSSNSDDSLSGGSDDRNGNAGSFNSRSSSSGGGSSPSARQSPTAFGQAQKSGSSSHHEHRVASGVGNPPAFTMPSDIAHGLSGHWDDDDF